MHDELTTYGWCRATGGALTREQSAHLRRQILAGYGDHVRGLLQSLPHGDTGERPTLPVFPDSALTQAACEAAADQGPELEGHGWRTWFLGAALARRDGERLDAELFHVAALTHDAGGATPMAGQDFTVRSADIAVSAFGLAGRELSGLRVSELRDGIVSHATVGTTSAESSIGMYVQAGAMLDLVGLRLSDLPRSFVRAVFDAFPQAGVRRRILRLFAEEARALPTGRFAQLKRLGVPAAIRFSPTRRF